MSFGVWALFKQENPCAGRILFIKITGADEVRGEMKVKAFLTQFDDTIGYDLEITDDKATVQCYLDAVNRFQEKHVAGCKGCDGCCWERIPLTAIDVINYLSAEKILSLLPPKTPLLSSFVHRFCHVFCKGPVIDITLKNRSDGACIFLDTRQKICTHHSIRSLVCQTYVCLPHSEKAGRLRDTILNTGEDELVRRYLFEARSTDQYPKIDEGINASPSLEDYPPTPFSGKNRYEEILIKDIIPSDLWKNIYKP